MIVCHCHAIRSREIEDVIARGARTTSEVARACRAGQRCGGCRPAIAELIAARSVDLAAQNPRADGVAGEHTAADV